MLHPMFSYYGSKWRIAPLYPAPQHRTVVEPFAGGAGYSLVHYDRKVILVEKDPIIFALWNWLIHVRSSEVRALPIDVMHVDDVHASQEAKWLIGFWMNHGSAQPKKSASKWIRSKGHNGFAPVRDRIADEIEQIRHWTVVNKSYEEIPADGFEATWFVDPPYQKAGKYYRESSKNIDFAHLGAWCRSRAGQTIVCENEGADWLPFSSFVSAPAAASQGKAKRSEEVIWLSDVERSAA